jgi:hypothetical protein
LVPSDNNDTTQPTHVVIFSVLGICCNIDLFEYCDAFIPSTSRGEAVSNTVDMHYGYMIMIEAQWDWWGTHTFKAGWMVRSSMRWVGRGDCIRRAVRCRAAETKVSKVTSSELLISPRANLEVMLVFLRWNLVQPPLGSWRYCTEFISTFLVL